MSEQASENGDTRAKMLEANGLSPFGLSQADREQLVKIIERGRKRVRRVKIMAIAAWIFLLLAVVIIHAITVAKWASSEGRRVGIGILTPVFFVAVALTISYLVKTYVQRHRERQAQVTEITARLAGIESELRKIAAKGDD